MKKKTSPVIVVLLLAGLVAVMGIAAFIIGGGVQRGAQMDFNAYYNISSDDEVALITDEGISEQTGRLIDGEVYLPYKTVSDDISGSIFSFNRH